MKHMIRWRGLLVFSGIVGAIILFFGLFFDGIAKRGLEAGLTQVNGAEVNIAEFNLSYWPFGVQLKQLEFTDPLEPTVNKVVIGEAAFDVKFSELLIGNVYIKRLDVAQLQMNTPRKKAGFVVVKEVVEDDRSVKEQLADLNIHLPNSEEFFQRADIHSIAAAKKLEQDLQQRQEQVVGAYQSLPSEERLKGHIEAIQAIIDAKPSGAKEIAQALEELKKRKKLIQEDKQHIESFVALSKNTWKDTQSDFAQVQEQYRADVQKAQELFSFESDALIELSGVLFGEEVETWVGYANTAYTYLMPLLQQAKAEEEKPERLAGSYIHFDNKKPRFLAQQVGIHILTELGEFDVQLEQLTWEHDVIDEPTRYSVASTASSSWEQLQAQGQFSLDREGQVVAQQTWSITGIPLAQQALLEQSGLSIGLQQANLINTGTLTIDQGQIQGQADFAFEQAQFHVDGSSSVSKYLQSALENIHHFSIQAGLSGHLLKPRIGIQSDLDNQVGKQFQQQLVQEAQQHLAKVESELQGHFGTLQGKYQQFEGQLGSYTAVLQEYQEQLNELLDVDVDSSSSKGLQLLKKFKKP